MSQIIAYGIADALGFSLNMKNNELFGTGSHEIDIAGLKFPFEMKLVAGRVGASQGAVMVKGPGDLMLVVHVEYPKSSITPSTTVFILGKSPQRPVPALPDKIQSLTLKKLKALYGPLAVKIVTRDEQPQTDWVELAA